MKRWRSQKKSGKMRKCNNTVMNCSTAMRPVNSMSMDIMPIALLESMRMDITPIALWGSMRMDITPIALLESICMGILMVGTGMCIARRRKRPLSIGCPKRSGIWRL